MYVDGLVWLMLFSTTLNNILVIYKHNWFSVDNYYYCIIIISSSSSSMPMIYSTIKLQVHAGLIQNTHLHLFKVVLNNINQTKPSTYIILYKLITDNPLRTSQFIIIWIKYHMLYCTFKVLCIVDGNGSSSCPLVLKRRKTYQMSC
jgi:hypothetical protein